MASQTRIVIHWDTEKHGIPKDVVEAEIIEAVMAEILSSTPIVRSGKIKHEVENDLYNDGTAEIIFRISSNHSLE